MNRDKWLAERRTGIGSSDVAALLGIDSFGRTPIDVFLSKVNPDWKTQESPILRQGLALEPVIAKEYSEQTGRKLYASKEPLFRHAKYPELIATPDRLVKGERRFVELKCEFFGHNKFGQAGSDQVPDNYLVQVAHQYLVLDYDSADIARMRPGHETEIFPIARDKELEELIIDRAREFWHTYVLPKKEPPIDYGATWAKYLAHKFPKDQGAMLAIDSQANLEDAPTEGRIMELAELNSEIAALEKHKAELEHHLKAAIGDNSGLIGPWGKITWKLSKDKVEDVTDWEKVAYDVSGFVPGTAWHKALATYTIKNVVLRKGSRRFILEAKENS